MNKKNNCKIREEFLIIRKNNITLPKILQIIDKYIVYLKDRGFRFDKNGYPIFSKEMFLEEWAELIVPFTQRLNKIVRNKKKTLICFFDKDNHLYQRLLKVFDEIDEYKKYMGVIGLDITFTNDMDEEWQRLTSLLNMLFMAVLAANGIKIVLNTRSAALSTQDLFKNIPHGIMAASGFLGCKKVENEADTRYISKILTILPSKLFIYGKQDKIVEKQLNNMGINYRRQLDFHRLCKEVA